MNSVPAAGNLASFSLHPERPVVAGEFGTWTISITIGERGVDDGGTIKISQRGSTDWSVPQFIDEKGDGYSSIHHHSAAKLTPRFGFKEHVRPYFWCLTIDVSGDSLAPGEVVTVVLGDISRGSRGIRAQSFIEKRHEFALDIDPTNSNQVSRAARVLLEVVAAAPVRARVIVPSTIEEGQSARIFSCGEDLWGNPVAVTAIRTVSWLGKGQLEYSDQQVTAHGTVEGYLDVEIECAGIVLRGRSNPLRSRPVGAARLVWGDMHAQTGETVGAGDEDEYFTFARDIARLDFTSHQGNDFQISDDYWDHLNRVTASYHKDGSFVVFPGYEWSGNSTVGGDRNVWYLREGQPIFRSSPWLLKGPIRDPLAPTVQDLFSLTQSKVGAGNYLLGAHVGGRYADVERGFDPVNGPLVEVVSCWGVFEWIIFDAFRQGHRVGIVANSDGHKGRPGAEHPGALDFGIRGGLTAVSVSELTRQEIFDALHSRRCYGTTGARILLDCQLGAASPGDAVTLSEAEMLQWSVLGTAPLERVELYQSDRCVETVWAPEFVQAAPSRRIRLLWGGSECRGRTRRIIWKGEISVGEDMRITQFQPVCFDTPSDGITREDERRLSVFSRTTGDADGVDLIIEGDGPLTFSSGRAREVFDTGKLKEFTFRDLRSQGGLDAFVSIARYPEAPSSWKLSGSFSVTPGAGETPWFVKVVQSDGEMAWASPFYVCAS